MTVKELRELLDGCNDDATVYIVTDAGSSILEDRDVFAEPDGETVSIDVSVASLAYGKEQK